ncbi:hypothetical protein [Rhodococcus globerulus]|uniref:hypothetical protein n=1 Tax=Rhodococcus globerulus TaxID=33008 RepID=UPI001C592889|nr:hypothetical protein [Rhodococcus globerulus]QXW04307.1 hypothetical protein KYT97_09930 [Rhodococcus globerulus]
MPPKRRVGMPQANQNRRPKIAGSARSLNVPAGTPAEEPANVEAVETEVAATEAVETEAVETEAAPKASLRKAPKPSLEKEAQPSPEKEAQPSPEKEAQPSPETAAEPSLAEEPPAPEPALSKEASRTSWPLVIGLGAAAVVVALLAGLAFFKVGAQMDDVAWVDEGATAEVLRVTPPALEAVFTFAPGTFDADFDKGLQGLNQAMRDQLTEYKDTQKAGVEQTQTATTADVTEIGVTRLEEDRAQLLAQLNVSSTQSGVAAGSRSGMVVVSLEKQDGNWLISEIRDR